MTASLNNNDLLSRESSGLAKELATITLSLHIKFAQSVDLTVHLSNINGRQNMIIKLKNLNMIQKTYATPTTESPYTQIVHHNEDNQPTRFEIALKTPNHTKLIYLK